MARQWQCNPVCVLCNQEQETAAHLILHCPFARLVWERVEAWTNKLIQYRLGIWRSSFGGKRTSTSTKEDKKNKSSIHDVQRLEHMEGKEAAGFRE